MMYALLLLQAATVPVPALPCTTDAVLPPVLSFWNQPQPGPMLKQFRPMVLATTMAGKSAPAKPGRVAAIDFEIDQAGDYTIALGAAGWIDVTIAAGGKPLASVGHGHGPPCTTIRKLVAFRLAPGRYRVQLSGLTGAQVKVALVPGNPEQGAKH